MQESEFIEGLKRRDQNTFRELVNRYQLPLIRLCKGFLHNDEDAKDVTQDTFIEIIDSIYTFRGDAKLETWLFRIAINKSLNLIRKNKYQIPFSRMDFMLPQGRIRQRIIQEQQSTQLDHAELKGRKHQIKKALDGLPKNQRIALVLNKYLDLSYKEIAEVMQISVSAVESLIHRSKSSLQKKLYKMYRKNLL